MTEVKSLNELTERMGDLSLLRRDGTAQEQYDRQQGIMQLQRDVEDAYDNCSISDEQYAALLKRIKEQM